MFTWFLVVGYIAFFVASFFTGANDVANSFGSCYGSRTLTIGQIILIASICELIGAVLLGGEVAKSVGGKIADLSSFDNDPFILSYGFLCTIIATGGFMAIATFMKFAISATHAVVAGVIGFALVFKGADGVLWATPTDSFPYIDGFVPLVASWIISPLVASILSYCTFVLLRYVILRQDGARLLDESDETVIAAAVEEEIKEEEKEKEEEEKEKQRKMMADAEANKNSNASKNDDQKSTTADSATTVNVNKKEEEEEEEMKDVKKNEPISATATTTDDNGTDTNTSSTNNTGGSINNSSSKNNTFNSEPLSPAHTLFRAVFGRHRASWMFGIIVFITLFVNMFFIFSKGMKDRLEWEDSRSAWISVVIGVVFGVAAAVAAPYLLRRAAVHLDQAKDVAIGDNEELPPDTEGNSLVNITSGDAFENNSNTNNRDDESNQNVASAFKDRQPSSNTLEASSSGFPWTSSIILDDKGSPVSRSEQEKMFQDWVARNNLNYSFGLNDDDQQEMIQEMMMKRDSVSSNRARSEKDTGSGADEIQLVDEASFEDDQPASAMTRQDSFLSGLKLNQSFRLNNKDGSQTSVTFKEQGITADLDAITTAEKGRLRGVPAAVTSKFRAKADKQFPAARPRHGRHRDYFHKKERYQVDAGVQAPDLLDPISSLKDQYRLKNDLASLTSPTLHHNVSRTDRDAKLKRAEEKRKKKEEKKEKRRKSIAKGEDPSDEESSSSSSDEGHHANKEHDHGTVEIFDPLIEGLFRYLQVFSSCFLAAAHGSSTVASIAGPIAAIQKIYDDGQVSKEYQVEIWVLVIGAVGLSIGLAAYGQIIMKVLGEDLATMSPSRGFVVQFSTALCIVLSASIGLPVSSTMVNVGSVVGCAWAETGTDHPIDWRVFGRLSLGWLLTIVVTACISATLFAQGIYAPKLGENYTVINNI